MKIHRYGNIEYWYDRSTRCWWAREVDSKDNQIGDAEHAYNKNGINYIVTNWNSLRPDLLEEVRRRQ